MEILSRQNKLFTNTIFHDNIERLFLIFKTPEFFQVVYQKTMTDIHCLKGCNSLVSIGSEFQFTFKGALIIRFRVDEVINLENEKMIKLYFYLVGTSKLF